MMGSPGERKRMRADSIWNAYYWSFDDRGSDVTAESESDLLEIGVQTGPT